MVFWVKTIKDELRPPGVSRPTGRGRAFPRVRLRPQAAGGSAAVLASPQASQDEQDEELAAYNAYLARLHQGSEGPRQVARSAVAVLPAPDDTREVGQVRLNVTLYRVMAYVTGVVLIVLCVLAIPSPSSATRRS